MTRRKIEIPRNVGDLNGLSCKVIRRSALSRNCRIGPIAKIPIRPIPCYVTKWNKAMAFSETELKRIDKFVGGFCRKKSPEEYKDQLKFEYRIKGHEVLILEIRSRWNNPEESSELSVAKLKFNRTKNIWQLYWQRANMKYIKYDGLNDTNDLGKLVSEIETDRYGCFFG